MLSGTAMLRAQGMVSSRTTPAPRAKPSGIPFLAHFTDVGKQAGLRFPTICGPVARKEYLLETIGCGVAFIDYDNDGWQDIFVLSGTRFNDAPAGTTNRLYKNNRDGTFTDVTAKAHLTREGWACGVTVGDYDNDGLEDIFVTYYGENALYRNNGDGTFADITAKAGLKQPGALWGSGCTFIDFDRDGHLDLFIANYVGGNPKNWPTPGRSDYCRWKGIPVCCGPRGLPGARNYLFHNNGDGTFSDVSEASGIAAVSDRYALTALAADLDDDGWSDLYVACDSTPSLFFRNQRDGTFKEEGLQSGLALTVNGMEQAGMGLAIGDVDLDGHLDLLKTNFADDTVTFYRNDGGGYFSDLTFEAGFGVETRYTC
jgi:enediyne biosynthesis protein E4